MQNKKYIYLVRTAKSRKELQRDSIWFSPWWFLARNYNTTGGGIPISVFSSHRAAEKAIAREKRIFKQMRLQMADDIKLVKSYGLNKRYTGIIEYMMSKLNAHARNNKLYYKIQPVLKEKWEQICDTKGVNS